MSKAKVTEVKMGLKSVEGLMNDKAEFAVAVVQAYRFLNLVPEKNVKKALKPLLSGVSNSGIFKWETEIAKRGVYVLTLEQFEEFVKAQAKQGNKEAQEFIFDLFGMSLTQLFSDAFKQRFDEEDRQCYLQVRQIGKMARRTLTDGIKDWLDKTKASKLKRQFAYSNASDALNKGLFGKKAKQLCEERNVKDRNYLRDAYTVEELRKVCAVEEIALYLIDNHGYDPLSAIKDALRQRGCAQ